MEQAKNCKTINRMRFFSLAGTVSIFFLIVLGGILRTAGTTGVCLEWPACAGIWTLPVDINSTAALIYRWLTLIVGLFLLSGVIVGLFNFTGKRSASAYYLSALIFLIQVAFDRILFISGNHADFSWLSSAHLGFSLIILSLVAYASLVSFLPENEHSSLFFNTRFAKLSLSALIVLLVSFISGAVITSSGAAAACTSWPVCEGLINPVTLFDWINLIHRLSAVFTGILLLLITAIAWRNHRSNLTISVLTTAASVLFYSQALLASQMVGEYPAYQLVLHQSTAVAVWVTLIIYVVYVGISNLKIAESMQVYDFKDVTLLGKLKDLFMLTKPVVVALLLVTTYAGMVIGSKQLPDLTVAFWTMLGGFMAAGGSGAINQYIDRFDDFKMQRTQKRPIPSGRLTPSEGLAFGIAMTLGSFYVMVAFVNLPAALLTLAGIVYYVFIYSIFLKKSTVQNIVIGGGAGAIPPLVGWASATGGLNIPSLFLFAVVFMWTPPHFWALALVRRKDYARAGVPMLPVVRGEKETRWQILLYTIELFGLTLLLPIFGLGGSVYFIGAILLGIWLLSAAWRVWKQGGNKSAWKMYRYSSMYLAFLFMALMLDALL
jgi:heme o synthase